MVQPGNLFGMPRWDIIPVPFIWNATARKCIVLQSQVSFPEILSVHSYILKRYFVMFLKLFKCPKGWFPLTKVSIESDRIGTKLNPRMCVRYQFSVPVWSINRMIKSWSIFSCFGQAVRIIQDRKKSNLIRSDAYFLEWKPALSHVCGCASFWFGLVWFGNMANEQKCILKTIHIIKGKCFS